jgi:dCMP deaminase
VTRPTLNQWGLMLARVVATRATCARRQVGCVLLDAAGHVLATGYNGPPRGMNHCTPESPCAGANAPSGTELELCEAVHAEQNALLQCRDPALIYTCCVTVSPCVTCTKLLLNTGCKRVVFLEPYAHDDAARRLWLCAGPTTDWFHVDLKETP